MILLWYNAVLDFENGTVALTVKDAAGNVVADNIAISTNAKNFASMIAEDYYSLADMVVDNFALYETN